LRVKLGRQSVGGGAAAALLGGCPVLLGGCPDRAPSTLSIDIAARRRARSVLRRRARAACDAPPGAPCGNGLVLASSQRRGLALSQRCQRRGYKGLKEVHTG